MEKDQSIGLLIFVASIIGILAYLWLVITYPLIVLQITAFVGVALLLAILGWIGWTMARTPPPPPIEPDPDQPVEEPSPAKTDKKQEE